MKTVGLDTIRHYKKKNQQIWSKYLFVLIRFVLISSNKEPE